MSGPSPIHEPAAANPIPFRRVVRLVLGLALVPALLFSSFASAGTILDQGRVEASTSVEGLPDSSGDSWARIRHGLALRADLTSRISLIASGQLYYAASGAGTEPWDESTIQRLSFGFTGRALSVRVGRFVHVGSLGLTRVDGFQLDLHPDGPLGGHVWAGRVGHPEEISPGGDLGAGAQIRLVPGALGLAAGYDLRKTPVDLVHRVHVSSTLRARGASLFAVVELGLGPDIGLGANAHAAIPLGTRAQLRLGGRYYGLPPVSVPWSGQSVIEAIRPTDYGVGEVAIELRPRNQLRIRLEGGPTLGQKATGYEVVAEDSDTPPGVETELGVGATARASLDWRGLGLYGTGTAVGGAWYAGGGAGAHTDIGPLALRGEAGLFRFRGLDGVQATVGEARFQGGITLPSKPTWGEFGLVFRAAVGADRQLSPWWRAGVALQGRLGSARGAL